MLTNEYIVTGEHALKCTDSRKDARIYIDCHLKKNSNLYLDYIFMFLIIAYPHLTATKQMPLDCRALAIIQAWGDSVGNAGVRGHVSTHNQCVAVMDV